MASLSGSVVASRCPGAAHARRRLPLTALTHTNCTSPLRVLPCSLVTSCRCSKRNGTRRNKPLWVAASAAIAIEESPDGKPKSQQGAWIRLAALVALVLATGVTNRVLYKMALVPLKDHIFFLAQLQNLGYLAVYFTALALRSSSGVVTPAMLSIDKRPLVAVGGCEALAQLLFMAGAAHIPGPLLPVVNQTYLVWSLVVASVLLGARYTKSQLAGAALVMVGVVAAAVPPAVLMQYVPLPGVAAAAGTGAAAAAVELKYVLMCVLCFLFPAIANCIKERVFRRAAEQLGRPLDIFVVNSFGSLAQTFFVLLLLPATTALNGVALHRLPELLAASMRVFMGLDTAAAGAGAGALGAAAPALGPWGVPLNTPLLALSYVAMNLAFNVSMLTLLRSVGSVTTTIVGSSLVPLTIAAFTLPLPYLEPAVLSYNFVVGVVLLMAGLLTYNWHNLRDALRGRGGGGHGARAQAGGDDPPPQQQQE